MLIKRRQELLIDYFFQLLTARFYVSREFFVRYSREKDISVCLFSLRVSFSISTTNDYEMNTSKSEGNTHYDYLSSICGASLSSELKRLIHNIFIF